jgi:hypothetical protein
VRRFEVVRDLAAALFSQGLDDFRKFWVAALLFLQRLNDPVALLVFGGEIARRGASDRRGRRRWGNGRVSLVVRPTRDLFTHGGSPRLGVTRRSGTRARGVFDAMEIVIQPDPRLLSRPFRSLAADDYEKFFFIINKRESRERRGSAVSSLFSPFVSVSSLSCGPSLVPKLVPLLVPCVVP